MSNLEEKTRKLNEQIKTFMDFISDQMIKNHDDLKWIDPMTIETMQLEAMVIDALMDTCLKQAITIDKMERDLDFIKNYLVNKK